MDDRRRTAAFVRSSSAPTIHPASGGGSARSTGGVQWHMPDRRVVLGGARWKGGLLVSTCLHAALAAVILLVPVTGTPPAEPRMLEIELVPAEAAPLAALLTETIADVPTPMEQPAADPIPEAAQPPEPSPTEPVPDPPSAEPVPPEQKLDTASAEAMREPPEREESPLPAQNPVPILDPPPPPEPRPPEPAKQPLPATPTQPKPAAIRPKPKPAPATTSGANSTVPPAMAPAQATAAQSTPEPPRVSASWRAAIAAWLHRHKQYPPAARRRGEEGTAEVRFTVERDGKVVEVVVTRGTGSLMLDEAIRTLLTGAYVPPFPADMLHARVTVTAQINFSLER